MYVCTVFQLYLTDKTNNFVYSLIFFVAEYANFISFSLLKNGNYRLWHNLMKYNTIFGNFDISNRII